MKLCKDCKHFQGSPAGTVDGQTYYTGAYCDLFTHQSDVIDMTDGRRIVPKHEKMFAIYARHDEELCGKEAKRFEEK